MSKDRYKWRLAFPVSFYEDIRDCEKEAQVLQLTWVGEETGRKHKTPGRQCKLHLKQSVCRKLEPSSSDGVLGAGTAKGSTLMSRRARC